MSKPLYLNGRFLTQRTTGVQRFATEIVAAMDRLAQSGGMSAMQVLAPNGELASDAASAPYSCFSTRRVGRLRGHAWEQIELPAHAHDGILVNLGNSGPVLAGRTQVVVIHDAGVFDTPETYSRQFRVWYKALWRILAQAGAQIATVSEFSRGRIANRLRLDGSRIHIMREGGDHMLRFPAAEEILAKHQLTPGRFALVVGSRVPHKNLAALGDLEGLLARRGMALAIAGSIDKAVFRSAESNFASQTRLLGRVTDAELRALYESAACLLFPTRYEGFGLPAVEAMTCNCPVITSGAGALREICGDAALYFDATRPGSLVETIERLLDQPDLADTLRTRGRRRTETFNWSNAALDLAGIIRNATTREVS